MIPVKIFYYFCLALPLIISSLGILLIKLASNSNGDNGNIWIFLYIIVFYIPFYIGAVIYLQNKTPSQVVKFVLWTPYIFCIIASILLFTLTAFGTLTDDTQPKGFSSPGMMEVINSMLLTELFMAPAIIIISYIFILIGKILQIVLNSLNLIKY